MKQNKQLEMSQQQVSLVASFLLMMAFLIFMIGASWGKNRHHARPLEQLTLHSFADTLTNILGVPPEANAEIVLPIKASILRKTTSSEHSEENVIEHAEEVLIWYSVVFNKYITKDAAHACCSPCSMLSSSARKGQRPAAFRTAGSRTGSLELSSPAIFE